MTLLPAGQLSSRKQACERVQSVSANASSAVLADKKAAGQSFDDLDSYLGLLGNAYDNGPIARGASVDSSALSNLIQSQGGGDAGLQAQAQFLQSQNDAGAAATNRYAAAMSAGQDAWNQSAQSEGKQSRQFVDNELSAQLLGMNSALDKTEAARKRQIEDKNFASGAADRQAMMQLIAQIGQIAAGAGINSPDIDIEALLGGLG